MSISENITEDTPLNARQRLFCDEYLIDLNATQAAIRAGYSTFSAVNQGSENLKKPHIRAYIDRELAKRHARLGVTRERVENELARLALCNTLDVIDAASATVRTDSNRDDTAAIASIKIKTIKTKDGTEIVEREIRMHDKNKSLEMLGKSLRMFDSGRQSDTGNLDKLIESIQSSKAALDKPKDMPDGD